MRESAEEEHLRVLAENAVVQDLISRWSAYPLKNTAEKYESNVHDGTIDKRLADYIYSEEPLEFFPDMGAPPPSYAESSDTSQS